MLKQQQSVALLITVSADTLAGVRSSIHACDTCSDNAQIPLTQLLDRFIGHFGPEREYVLSEDVVCPWCLSLIQSDTLVETQSLKGAAARLCS